MQIYVIKIEYLSHDFKDFTPFGAKTRQEDTLRTFALIIGISDYQQVDDLQYAHLDAKAFAQFLVSNAGGNVPMEQIKILLNEQATTGQIYAGFSWLTDHVKPGDRVFIYFSGHGDVESLTMKKNGFLLTYDTSKDCYLVGGYSVMYLRDVISTLSHQNQARVIVILDACRAGKLAGNDINGTAATAASLMKQYANEIKILSCQPNEYSLEGPQWGNGRGLFSYHLIRGLKGLADKDKDKTITVLELNNYLQSVVPKEADPQKQLPVSIGNLYHTVFPVNDSVLLALKQQKQPISPSIATIEQKSLMSVTDNVRDSSVLRLFHAFTTALDNKQLDDSWNIYSRLDSLSAPVDMLNTVKRNLAAALQDEAQQFLLRYLKAESHAISSSQCLSMAENLLKSAQLIGIKHYLYASVIAKFSFFIGTSYKFKAEDMKDTSEARVLYHEALKNYHQALELDSNAAYVYNEMGSVYMDLQQYQKSVSYFKKGIELAPSWTYLHNNLGIAYDDLEQYDQAIENYKKAIKIDPEYASAYNNLGYLYQKQKQYAKALQFYKQALQIKPDDYDVLVGIGNIFYDQKKYDEGLAYFQTLDPENVNADIYYSYSALFCLGLHKYAEALPLCLKSTNIEPNYAYEFNNVAYTYIYLDSLELAERYYHKAYRIDSLNFKRAGDLAGFYLVNMKNANKAKFYLEKTRNLCLKDFNKTPDNDELYSYLGMYYLRLDSMEQAEHYLQKAYNLNNEDNQMALALFHTQNGQIEEALTWFRQALSAGYSNYKSTQLDPALANLRKTKEYEKLMRKYFPHLYK